MISKSMASKSMTNKSASTSKEWDETSALKRINGNAALLEKLISIYKDSQAQLLTDIDDARSEEDRIKLANSAHALKGVAANLSADGVAHTAREVELRARSAEWKDVDSQILKLKESSENLLGIFAAYLGQ